MTTPSGEETMSEMRPVAWMVEDGAPEVFRYEDVAHAHAACTGGRVIPLYTTAQPEGERIEGKLHGWLAGEDRGVEFVPDGDVDFNATECACLTIIHGVAAPAREKLSTGDLLPHTCVPNTGGWYCHLCGRDLKLPQEQSEPRTERRVGERRGYGTTGRHPGADSGYWAPGQREHRAEQNRRAAPSTPAGSKEEEGLRRE